MSQYENFPVNFIRRTQKNLKSYSGKFEVSNLINNCLGLIIIPKQKLGENLPKYTFDDNDDEYGISKHNIELEIQDDFSLSNTLRHIRNGLAHGRIEQKTEKGCITGLRIHDKPNEESNENFIIHFTIKEFKKFAICVSNSFLTHPAEITLKIDPCEKDTPL